jgi:dinuclear metal center YbgI/SA1388 family protein
MILVQDIISAIEAFAPAAYQESYDNSGLQVGNNQMSVKAALLCLDVTEPILDEAIAKGANLIVAHHPLIFSGIKKITGANATQRIIQKAIKHDIAIYAAHTNLDNMFNGVNAKFASKLGLQQLNVLAPMPDALLKLYTYVPLQYADVVKNALFLAGAGHIGNYSECSFSQQGIGTFKPGSQTNPTIGTAGGATERVDELKIEVILPKHAEKAVLKALFNSHPYEVVAYDLVKIQNKHQNLGAGLIGALPQGLEINDFLNLIKAKMNANCIKYTPIPGKIIKKVAICGGSGSFLLQNAIQAGADAFISADFKYHQFFDAEGKIIICDIGHYESEQFTSEIFKEILNEKFPNFAVLLSGISTNPVNYFI